MFSLLTSAISSAADVLAPPTPLIEELLWRWDAVTNYYTDHSESKLKESIEFTLIPHHLNQINRILEEEESEAIRMAEYSESDGAIGQCMEYLLQNKLLDTMTVLAQTDVPSGMCSEVLTFVTRLLSNSKTELLSYCSVYSVTQKLVMLCGRFEAGPYEKSEVMFVTRVCNQINSNPHLINCFLRDSFPLIPALLSLLQSPDSEISTKAGDAMIRLISVINEKAAVIITHETPFSSKIVSQLVKLYHEIPRSLKAQDIDTAINNCFKLNDTNDMPNTTISSFAPAMRRFLCFLRWFILFDMIVNHTKEPILINVLLKQLRDDFLDSCIIPDLIGSGYNDQSDANDHIFLTTVLLSNCLRNLMSVKLASSIGEFLIMDSETEFIQEMSLKNRNLKSILINRCLLFDSNSPELSSYDSQKRIQLCMSTMQLFEEILNKPSLPILNTLVTKYVTGRGYYDTSVSQSEITHFDFDEFDDSRTRISSFFRDDPSEVSPGSSPSNHFSASHIYRILQYFTSLIPDELKSDVSDELGYETYVREAQKHYRECAIICDNWSWNDPINRESSASEDDNKSNDSQPEADSPHKTFEEGPFLSMVFDNLQNMILLPYEVNLQITSLISKLALFPHPNLNEYLLDPTLPLLRGTRSLFGVLHKLVDDLQISVHGVPNLKEKLLLTRKALLGEETNTDDVHNYEKIHIIEALIVIEEFCKELAAVSFVKYHNMN